MLRVNSTMPESRAQGPGLRYTIWTQGCSIHCPGCSNVNMWPFEGGQEFDTKEVIDALVDPNLDGVTITGGEPLDQFNAVYDLCSHLFLLTSVFLTTGYTEKQIERKGYQKIFDVLDIICMGPFNESLVCKDEWRGSSNQVIRFLTDLGRKQASMPIISKEIHIGNDGNAIETGFTA